ncbi:hypothetical protein DVH05_007088 [Phytophthora capsici]|nr:hypothetical protein DVH05_007088 [Phytophthora capsici]
MVWERIAGRQSSLRLRSEEENAKLREAVTQHLQQAKSLQRAIKRKLREDLVSSSMDLFRSHRLSTRGVMPPLDNKAVFDMLLTGLDDVYENVDGFFETMGMQTLPCPGRKNNTMESRRSRGMFVEFLDNYPLPGKLYQFDLDSFEPHVVLSFLVQKSTAGSNTKMASMSISVRMAGVDFWVIQRCVTRKYLENGRVVFVRRAMIQPTTCISFIETTRMILKPGDLSVIGPTTVMQTHRQATFYGDLSNVDTDKVSSMEIIGMKDWESSITRYNNRVEDQLVEAM